MAKKILITGEYSYIGNKLTKWLEKEPEKYIIIKESVRNEKWKEIDFSFFDVVVHVAGIAHQNTKNDQEELYYKINTDLTINIAKKAKNEGIKQFIFMSSIIVYGESSRIGETKVITKETIPNPTNFYGNSKLLAEKGIAPLQSDDFDVVIIRPPMIYGKGSKGNYPVLAKFASVSPVFPDIENQRSVLHIDNLTEFIKILIDNKEKGIFFPQNKKIVKTAKLVELIAKEHGKKIYLVRIFNEFIIGLSRNFIIFNKIFGNLCYDTKISNYKNEYCVRDLEETIKLTENN